MIETDRLLLRQWEDADIAPFVAMNQMPEVMRYFPELYSEERTRTSVAAYRKSISERGYGYFAAELKEDGRFIGFIGMMDQSYESPYTPATDVGYRLHPSVWGQGLATEGGRAVLDYARDCGLSDVIAVTPHSNLGSQRVMQKLGMSLRGQFVHPAIDGHHELQPLVVYGLVL